MLNYPSLNDSEESARFEKVIVKGRFEQIMKIRQHLVKNELSSCWESDQLVGLAETLSEGKLKT
jgi:hypothetical protein